MEVSGVTAIIFCQVSFRRSAPLSARAASVAGSQILSVELERYSQLCLLLRRQRAYGTPLTSDVWNRTRLLLVHPSPM